MNIERKASHVLTCGRSGTGKTTYILRYLLASHHDRVFIFDHQAEFIERLHLIPCYELDDIAKRARTERIIAFDYSKNYYGEMEETFDLFCDKVFFLCKDHLESQNIESVFVCDELSKVTTVSDCPKPLKNIVQTGRRYNLDTALMSQQPNRIHNEVREQVTELVLFNLKDENSLKFVKKMGFDEQPVMALPDLHYIWFNTKSGETRKSEIKYTKYITQH